MAHPTLGVSSSNLCFRLFRPHIQIEVLALFREDDLHAACPSSGLASCDDHLKGGGQADRGQRDAHAGGPDYHERFAPGLDDCRQLKLLLQKPDRPADDRRVVTEKQAAPAEWQVNSDIFHAAGTMS